MTDFELNNLELFAKGIKADAKTTNDKITGLAILDLVADLRQVQAELLQARAERDWMMRQLDIRKCCPHGKVCENEYPSLRMGCYPCWRKAAKEATCPKN